MIMVEIGITTGEAAVEAWIGMVVTGIVEGTEIIVVGVGVAVIVLITIEAGAEIAMTMADAIVVDQLTVPLQDEVQFRVEVPPHAGVLRLVVLVQGVILQRSATLMSVLHLLRQVLLVVVDLEVLVVPDLKKSAESDRREVGTNWKW